MSADDGDTATTGSDCEDAGVDELRNFAAFDDVDWFRRGDNTTIAAPSVFAHRPAAGFGESLGLGGGVELADWFRRILEGGVGGVDEDLGDDAGDRLRLVKLGERIIESLSEPIADLALAHRDGGFERHSGGGVSSCGFFVDENIADLRAVAVDDDDVILLGELRDRVANLAGDLFLCFGGRFAVFLEGVTAESDNDACFLHCLSIDEKEEFGKFSRRARGLVT